MPVDNYFYTGNERCYYITLNVVDWVDVFIRPVYKNAIVESLNEFTERKGLIIHAWCLMSNHLHLLARTKQDYDWPYVFRELKRYTSQEVLAAMNNDLEPDCRRQWMMQRFESPANVTRQLAKYHFWQDGFHPELCKTNEPASVLHIINRIHQNPVRTLIVDKPESYIYSSARDYDNHRGLVKITPFRVLNKSI
jgi:REP element-mobilizing transposase RayT